jgi:NAD(P)-dependent dehydrogenase (short-subunit alcohol dehydrogenase family)
MNISIEEKVALVTGAASGLGLATAKAFAESGASVALADWNEDAVHAAAQEPTAQGLRPSPFVAMSPMTCRSMPWSSRRSLLSAGSMPPIATRASRMSSQRPQTLPERITTA